MRSKILADAPVLDRPSHRWGKDLFPVPTPDLQATGKMGNMATEIVAFLLTISGWILVSSTLPTDYWKVSSVDGTVITTATFWSNLWKTCVTDSTGVSNCKDFPSMLALDGEFWDDWGCCCCSRVWCCLSEFREQRQKHIYRVLRNCALGTIHLTEAQMPKIFTCCFGWMTTFVYKCIWNLIFPVLDSSGQKQPQHLKLKATRGIFQWMSWAGMTQLPNGFEWSNLRKAYSHAKVTCHFPLLSSNNKEKHC